MLVLGSVTVFFSRLFEWSCDGPVTSTDASSAQRRAETPQCSAAFWGHRDGDRDVFFLGFQPKNAKFKRRILVMIRICSWEMAGRGLIFYFEGVHVIK